MRATYKKELYRYLCTNSGCLITFFILLFSGIFFTIFNIIPQNGNFTDTVNMISYILLLTVPILNISYKKNEAGVELVPIHPFKQILGEFAAKMTLLSIPFGVIGVYPLFLLANRGGDIFRALSALVGLILFSALLFSIGMAISALAGQKASGSAATFVLLFILYLFGTIQLIVPFDANYNFLIISAVISVLFILGYLYTSYPKGIIISWLCCLLIPTAIYLLTPDSFYGLIYKLLGFLSITRGFYSFSNGIISIEGAVFYITFTLLFLFFASILPRYRGASVLRVLPEHKKLISKHNKNRSFYIFTASLLLFILCLGINLLIYTLPSDFNYHDISSSKYHSISNIGTKYLTSLDNDNSNRGISVYLCSGGDERDDELYLWLTKIDSLSSSLSFFHIDTDRYPEFPSAFTSDQISENSIIVSGDKGTRIIRNEDLYLYGMAFMENELGDSLNYDTVQHAKNSYIEKYRDDYGIDISSYFSYFPTHYVRERVLLTSISEICGKAIYNVGDIEAISINPPDPQMSELKIALSSVIFSFALPCLYLAIGLGVIRSRKNAVISINSHYDCQKYSPDDFSSVYVLRKNKKAFPLWNMLHNKSRRIIALSVCTVLVFIPLCIQFSHSSTDIYEQIDDDFLMSYLESEAHSYEYADLTSISPAKVTEFSFNLNGKEYIYTKKSDGGWRCNIQNAVTDALSVTYALNKLADIKIYKHPSVEGLIDNEENREKLGLSDGMTIKLTFEDESVVTFTVGDYMKFGSAHYFTTGDGKIYAVLNRFTQSFTALCP